jgi:6-phosphogluconolactonase
MNDRIAFIGTYTDEKSEKIGNDGTLYRIRLHDDGSLERLGVTAAGENSSFLTIHPNGSYLYALSEVADGTVTAFTIDPSGALSQVNRRTSGASGPCHCTVDAAGTYLFVAHYTGGAVSVLPIQDDGGIGDPMTVVTHEGSSVHPRRQTEAHPHSVRLGPNGRFAYVPDLGTDEIVVYEFDDGALHRVEAVSVHDGAGPRHLEFHPDGAVCFLVNELASTLSAFEYHETTGSLTHLDTVDTVPEQFIGENLTADVHVHPSGRWVYCSNRGHDSIAVFEFERERLQSVGHESTRGEWPRNFALDPAGEFLYAENQRTDEIISFCIDETTGTLAPAGHTMVVPRPACMKILDGTV